MAFNWKTFQTRTLTAIVFAAVMLIGLLWNQWSFLILFSIIHFGCWWEYLKLMEKIHQVRYDRYLKLGLMLIGYGLMLWFYFWIYFMIGLSGWHQFLSLATPFLGFILLLIGLKRKNISSKNFWNTALGLPYISLTLGLLMSLYFFGISDYQNHPPIPCDYCPAPNFFQFRWSIPIIIIFSLWINDTMAYIIGSIIGKTPLSKISPKKTWEGTIGGIVLSIGIASFAAWLIDFNIIKTVMTVAIVSIAGTFGDLLESKLKRMAGVKDSGNIMPGHGGFLDRFDSLLLAIPAVWLYVFLLM